MPPEERERFIQRMRERGFGSREGGPQERNATPRDSLEGGAVGAAPGRPAGSTIDSLFGPLPTSESYGRVWVYVGGQLKLVRVRLGVSDGTQTELLSGNLSEGAELVTGVVLENESASDSSSGTGRSPLMGPDRRQRMPVRNAPPDSGGGRR
jgi:hypothetical protein